MILSNHIQVDKSKIQVAFPCCSFILFSLSFLLRTSNLSESVLNIHGQNIPHNSGSKRTDGAEANRSQLVEM